jgi:predicted GH43/DUF377 family glycosyl hydrolase
MSTLFDTILHSGVSLGDIRVAVDPFTGRVSAFLPAVTRLPGGPLLTADRFFQDVQAQALRRRARPRLDRRLATLADTFNPGVAHFDGGYLMLVRFQNTMRFNSHFVAVSRDGIRWEPRPRVLDLPGLPRAPRADTLRLAHPRLPRGRRWRAGVAYDARITQMAGGDYLVTFAVDYDTLEPAGRPYVNICDNVLYRTRDFRRFTFVSAMAGNARNTVLFPRRIGGWFWAASRPNGHIRPGEAASGQETVLLRSRDLVKWEKASTLFHGGHGWMNYGGPGFPPFETAGYWVMGVHGVEVHGTHRVHYRAGVCLIDKRTMKLAGGPVPLIDPREPHELSGVVDNVVFPSGVLFGDGRGHGVKRADTKVAIFYGAADRAVGVALTTVERLTAAALGRHDPFAEPHG